MAINKELINQIINKLEEAPEAYDQSSYGRFSKNAPCGTAACIAGWAYHFSTESDVRDPDVTHRMIHEGAARALGLTEKEAAVLFDGYAFHWPQEFKEAFWTEGQASAAIAYLRHILKTGKVTK